MSLQAEAGVYGYTDENRHIVECFRKGEKPMENFEDGLAVIEILMGLDRAAESGETIRFSAPELGGLRAAGGAADCLA